ncbi:MAG: hypothetical protein PWP76_384 [Candidatus Diapherotrites archaeon]|nr:hypothetical protein [Candidatus Diapherotrites archaeon]
MRRGQGVLEDVPMVVPIALALILFFVALSWATSTVNRTNTEVDLTLALIRVADAFAQWGVLTDSSWDTSCGTVQQKETSVYFYVYLVDPADLDASLASFASSISALSAPSNAEKTCVSPGARPPVRGEDVLIRFFPVTYQNSGDVIHNDVKFLVVAVWPKG